MRPEEIFHANLALVDRVIAAVCRRAGLRDADAEDFASIAKLELIENDYAILRGFEGRAPLGAFLTVVVQRILTRERLRIWGRWHPSAEAERLGAAAVLLEKLIVHEKRPLGEAIPIVCASDPSLDRARVRELADRLPLRAARPRLVPLAEDEHQFAASDAADARAQEAETRRMSERAAQVVRETMETLSLQDRMLLKFHFGAELSIAETSRLLGVPQRPLYRRVEALLRQLRGALEREGVGAAVVEDLISAGVSEGTDFGLRNGKNGIARHTPLMEERG
ncbi:MAG TPA: sigma-70 family RNA polymerase sigma factor [Thermoanaerobaculia bacterium]|nr:sigma-70 family RNA polymerase sigma factor [Thermoanaerobaculia bacterium]